MDYAISRALLEGRIGKMHLKIPLADLVNYGESVRASAEGEDVVLRIDIETSWDVGQEEFESEFTETEEPGNE